jgi:Hypoxia induced protein conserved region
LVPLGTALTVFAFVQAWRAIRRGDSRAANIMFRYRVGAQAFTVLAMVVGGIYYNNDRQRTKELRKLEEQTKAEEKRQKWIRELEARDAEEKAMRAALERRRHGTVVEDREVEAETGRKEPTGGILGSLGLWTKPADAEVLDKEKAKVVEAGTRPKRERNPKSSLGELGEIFNKKPGDKEKKSDTDLPKK